MNSHLRWPADKAPLFGVTICVLTRCFLLLKPTYQFGGAPIGYCSKSNTAPVTHSLWSLAK